MKAPNDTCNTPDLMTVDEARDRIMTAVSTVSGVEQLFVRDALNRVLAEPVISSINVPSFDNSAMDGYGLNSQDLPTEDTMRLTIVGKAMAGAPYPGKIQANLKIDG